MLRLLGGHGSSCCDDARERLELGRTTTRNALSQERKATLGRARSSSPFAPRKNSYSRHTKVRTPFRTSGSRLLGRAGASSPFAPRKDFCGPFCGFAALREVLEDRKTNTLEQKDTKIANKSKTGDDFRGFQFVFQRRRQPPLKALPASSLHALCDLLFSSFFGFDRDSGAAISNSAASSCRRVSAIGRSRYCYQMDMIGHQAICRDLDFESVAPLCLELDVALVILFTKNVCCPRFPR
jgi:hypothetical protein